MKRITSLFLAVIMLITSLTAFSMTALADDWGSKEVKGVLYSYTITRKGIIVTDMEATKKVTNISVPSKFDGKSVVEIDAFVNEKIYGEITLPSTVKTIDRVYADAASSLKIGKNVSKINGGAFIFSTLKAIKVDSKNKSFSSSNGVLFNKDKTILLAYPMKKADKEYTIPKSVKTIGEFAFASTDKIKTLNIGDNVTAIIENAFMASKVQYVKIGKGLKDIEGNVFGVCEKLKSVSVSKDNKKFSSKSGILYNKDKTVLINYPINKTEKSYTVSKTVKTIGANAFSSNQHLKKIVIGDNVTKIGVSAFAYCDNLASISTPKKLTSIGEYAYSCTAIKSVKLPKTVTKLGYGAYSGCSKLSSVDITSTGIKKICQSTFSDTAIKSIKIPKTVTTIEDSAFAFTPLKSVTIPSNVKSLGKFAFYGCNKLESATVPASIKTIDSYTFDGCYSLTSLTVKGKDTAIKDFAIPYDYVEEDVYDESGNVIDWNIILEYSDILTIKAPKDSKAYKFAKKNNVSFKAI